MGRDEGSARARFWFLVGGGAVLGMVGGLVAVVEPRRHGAIGIAQSLLLGAAVGAFLGFCYWFKHFFARE